MSERIAGKGKLMGKIIAVANQKGGVGKTTTAINLTAALAEAGKSVLAVDTDPQGNTTSGFGVDKNTETHTIYEMMIGDADVTACIRRDIEGGTHLIPANVNLAAAEIELIDAPQKEYILKQALDKVREDYDYILIDCPPSLSLLTINAMTAADAVLVPIQCEYYALEGLSQLVRTTELVRDRLNPDLFIEGVVFTMFDARTNLSAQVVENVVAHVEEHVFKTVIPRNIRLAEAPSYGKPINLYEPKSAGAEAYRMLAKEIMER